MGLFDAFRRQRPSDQYNRFDGNPMIPRWTRPPDRNTTDWIKAFSTSPRLAVVERIASDLSYASGKLYTVDSQGNEQEVKDHPFLRFWQNPNPLYEFSNAAVWRLHEIYLLLKGEGYFIIERDAAGRPAELWPVPVHWVMMTPYLNHPYYSIRSTSGQLIEVSVDDMFVMRDINPLDPFMRGLGQAEAIADEVEIDEYAAKFQKRFFFNDATPNLIISMPNTSEDQRKRFRLEWIERFKGVFKAHGVATTDGNITINKVSENMKDMDMIQGRLAMRNATLEHFGVPREIMGITESSNRATSEAAQFIYAQNVLMPKLRRREEAINQQLVPLFGQNVFWRFDDIVPRNQEFDKAKAVEAYTAGILTLNQALELLDHPPVDNGDVRKTTFSDVFIGTGEDPTQLSLQMANLQYADTPPPVDGDDMVEIVDTEDAVTVKRLPTKARSIKANLEAASTRNIDAAHRAQRARFEAATLKHMREQAERIATALDGGSKAAGSVWDVLNEFFQAGDESILQHESWTRLSEEEQDSLIESFKKGIIDWKNEERALLNLFTPLWRETYDKGAQIAQKTYGIAGINRPELISTAKLRGGMRVKHIEQTTKDAIGRIVANGIENGEGREAISKAIQQEMQTTTTRARLIADQETTTSLSAGEFDMMRKVGATTKTWHHRAQKNPRDGSAPKMANHVAMDGDTVPIEGRFANGLRYPRDPDGPAGEVIKCRCYVTYGGF